MTEAERIVRLMEALDEVGRRAQDVLTAADAFDKLLTHEEHAAAEGALMVLTQEKAEVAKLRAEAKRMALDYLALDGQRIEALAEIARLRAGIQAAVSGNIARPIGERWRADGEPSGHDRCIHGAMMNEDCPECLDAHLLALLGPAPDGGEGRG